MAGVEGKDMSEYDLDVEQQAEECCRNRIESLNHDLHAAQKRVQELEDELAENRPDLAIWWEARKSYMTGLLAFPRWAEIGEDGLDEWSNQALAAYKAKAAELAGKK